MKKILLLIVIYASFFLFFFSNVYAAPEETTSSAKSLSGYTQKCWNTHMVDEMAVCSKAHNNCVWACPQRDLKVHTLCLNECNNTLKVCYKKASADYKVCIEAERQAKKQQEIKQFKPNEAPLPQSKQSTQDFTDWITNTFGVFDPNKIEITSDVSDREQQRKPELTKEIEEELFEVSKKITQRSPYWVGYIRMETDAPPLIKYPGTDEFVPFGSLSEIKPGSIIRSENNQIAIVDNRDDHTIYIDQDSEVTIFDLEKDGMPLLLHQGEIEIKKERESNPSQRGGVKTDFFDLIIIGTHFWVSKDSANKQAVVGVYEGEVQIDTKDGQMVSVVPDNDLPGVVVVAQKLSITKLSVVALTVMTLTSVAVFIFKRNIFSKKLKKK